MADPIRVPEHLRGAHGGARWIDAETGHKLIRVRENTWLDAEGTGCSTGPCASLDQWWDLAVPPEPDAWELAAAVEHGLTWSPLIFFLAAVAVLVGALANRARPGFARFALAAMAFSAPLSLHPLAAWANGAELPTVHLAAGGMALAVFALCWLPAPRRTPREPLRSTRNDAMT